MVESRHCLSLWIWIVDSHLRLRTLSICQSNLLDKNQNANLPSVEHQCAPMIDHSSLHKLMLSDLYKPRESRIVGPLPLVHTVVVMIACMTSYFMQVAILFRTTFWPDKVVTYLDSKVKYSMQVEPLHPLYRLLFFCDIPSWVVGCLNNLYSSSNHQGGRQIMQLFLTI